jgi:hypothetical protein
MSKYPEHDKLAKVSDESQAIGTFLDWLRGGLDSPNLTLCYFQEPTGQPRFENDGDLFDGEELKLNLDFIEPGWTPARSTTPQLLAQYFGIDQEKLDAEKEQMLMDMRAKP